MLHEYNECWLYYSFFEHEIDSRMKKIWEHHLMMEIEHLKEEDKLLQKYENKKAQNLLPKELPELTKFQSNKDYVRELLQSQLNLSTNLDKYVDVKELKKDHRFHIYQNAVNSDPVPSTDVILKRIDKEKEDYRLVSEGEHPTKSLQSRDSVDEDVARK